MKIIQKIFSLIVTY